jgi:putative membrane protein
MGPEHLGWGGWWMFPMVMPFLMFVLMVIVLYFLFGRGGSRPPWRDHDRSLSAGDAETALEILKKRYARGEITSDEFQRIKKDIESR